MPEGPRTAVVLFNLGGPDSLTAVRPFLFNLFNDPAIIPLPTLARWLLARWISWRRAPVAKDIYRQIGGRSPLLPETDSQAVAVRIALADLGAVEVFVAMRYWAPRAYEVVRAVAAYRPDRVVLMPLYPQFSTTTTASSMAEWRRVAKEAGLDAPTHEVCCYPAAPGLIASHVKAIREALAAAEGPTRLLFSAHGLPKRVVEGGDPYGWQVERSAAAIVSALGIGGLEWRVCYQSRVGRLEWIGPSIDAEIRAAGKDGIGLIVVPIAFVSEHSETLVELDIDYRELATARGVPWYRRVPALGTAPDFIEGLAQAVRDSLNREGIQTTSGGRLCPKSWSGCPAMNEGARAAGTHHG